MLENRNSFIKWARLLEPDIDFDDSLTVEVLSMEIENTLMYIESLKPYLRPNQYEYLYNNFLLHRMCCNPVLKGLYNKHKIDDKVMIVNSASNSGSSSSIQSFKSLDEGRFMLMDLWRTPYGRNAYSILESLNNIAITLL